MEENRPLLDGGEPVAINRVFTLGARISVALSAEAWRDRCASEPVHLSMPSSANTFPMVASETPNAAPRA